ncbi:hypothetical protein P692DRAFT_20834493 [Suillus brevipes Sb2]|nr:hypothetical protein P692DRAFT_20834493 [Suillus brevipes Sb2]
MFDRHSRASKGPMHHHEKLQSLSMCHSDELRMLFYFNSVDDLEDDEEEVPDSAAVFPPRIQYEDIEIKTLANQSQPQAGPSCLAVPDRHLGVQSF